MLDEKINRLLDESKRMTLSTSVDGISSAASVFYARQGEDLVFFTFNPTRKAEQIRANPHVQAVIWPKDQEGIRGVQVEGVAYQIKDQEEIKTARELILSVTDAFKEFMDDSFLKKNKVTGYYRLKPTSIKYIDFYADTKFQWREFAENKISPLKDALYQVGNRVKVWFRAVRAPFFTGTIVPVLLGSVIAYNELARNGAADAFNWGAFWLALIGGILAHAGTNLGNDFFDHTSFNDEYNKLFSPFNGGSRMIQAGLIRPWKIFFAAALAFILTVLIGLELNRTISGAYFGSSPLLWIGFLGIALGTLYTASPIRLGYHGFGELSIALGFGPVMVLGANYVLTAPYLQANNLPWNWQAPLLASVPVAILIMLVVWINQFQDLPADKKVGKNTWVVRLAEIKGDRIGFEKPFLYYTFFNYFSFGFILMLGFIGFFKPELATPFVLISLLPVILVKKAVSMGNEWLERWNKPGADRQKLPYELLKVNVSSVGIHFITGTLLIISYWLGGIF